MLVAKPASQLIIREILDKINTKRSGVSRESYFLPMGESCNFVWNTLSTRNSALMLEWYVSYKSANLGISHSKSDVKEKILQELLVDILNNPSFSVISENQQKPLTIDYLTKLDNWISHAAGVAIDSAIADELGKRFSDIKEVTSENNPWLEITKYVLEKSSTGLGSLQKINKLKGGPRQVYLDIIVESTYFNRNKLYDIVEDIPMGNMRRRIVYKVYWVNYYFVTPEVVGWNHAVFTYIPLLFAHHPLLRYLPGFQLRPADVKFHFPDGDYSGTWEITIDYDTTPIDRIRSYFNVGELQKTIDTLSAEVLELQRDRKALSEEAERLAGQLIESEKLAAVGRLSFGVGHDLRNTLATAINSGIPLERFTADLQHLLELLETNQPLEDIQAFLDRRKLPLRLKNAPELYQSMMLSLAQALENVKALEGYSVQDASDFQEMRIEPVIEKVLQDHQAELSGIQLIKSFTANEYTFHGNPLKIYDIFQNLLLNAIEALEGREQPVLRIETRLEDGKHVAFFEDNGSGISEEVKKHAFEPFFTTKELNQGRQRGLGLFNVWRLVQQHQGEVGIESVTGEFTRFRVAFSNV